MKRLLLLACTIASFATISHAQIKKGSVLLGGSIGFNKSEIDFPTSDENKINSLYLSPTVGVAVKDNWVIGANAGFSRSRSKYTSTNYGKDNSFSGGLFARRYSALGKGFYLYGNASISYSKREQEQRLNIDNMSNCITKGVNLSVAPGIAYAVSKRFHLEAYLNDLISLGYTKRKVDNISPSAHSTTKERYFNFGTNFNVSAPLSIGFRFVLGK